MISPYEKEHYDFLDNLMFELYDEQTRNLIYDFYDKYDVKAYLPRQLDQRNWLEYIIEFRELSLCTDRFKVVMEDCEYSIWKIN